MAGIVGRRARRGEARAWLEHHLANIEDWTPRECIVWPFSTNGGSGGRYPQVNIDGQAVRVTRYVFEHVAGRPLATGELVRHTCDNPRCVNPWHFIGGDHAANMRDMVERERQASGERNGIAKLTEAQVREIRALANEHDLRGDVSFVARSYGVTADNIARVLARKTWVGVEP